MVLQSFSWPTFLAGVAFFAGALFLLQRLRVRPREQSVPTLLFWRQAMDETRVRVLVQQFRHPWPYLMSLALALLGWLAMADPVLDDGDPRRLVCLLDGSAGMAEGSRWEQACVALDEFLEGVDDQRREVLFCGARLRPLLAPGEAELLLEGRLAELRPEATPASLEAVVEGLVAGLGAQESCRIVVFGDAPLGRELLEGLPDRVVVQRGTPEPSARAGNRGVTALGVAESSSGRWGTVDVLAVVEGEAAARAGLSVSLDGAPYDDPGQQSSNARRKEWRWRDVPAGGGRFRVELASSDGLALDDRATLDLPERSALEVSVAVALAEVLGPVLDADPGVRRVAPDAAEVLVAETLDDDRPGLVFAPAADQAAFRIIVPEDLDHDAEERLRELLEQLALDQLDASAVASAVQRPVSVEIESGSVRRIEVWSELLQADAEWTPSRAFPLFLARALRWLAEVPEIRPWLAVAEPSPDGLALRAGEVPDGDGGVRFASLFEPSLTEDGIADELRPAPGTTGSGPLGLVSGLLLAVLALLAVDWVLYGRGRIP